MAIRVIRRSTQLIGLSASHSPRHATTFSASWRTYRCTVHGYAAVSRQSSRTCTEQRRSTDASRRHLWTPFINKSVRRGDRKRVRTRDLLAFIHSTNGGGCWLNASLKCQAYVIDRPPSVPTVSS